MNLAETLALIESLRANGVTRFKSHEHDIDLTGQSQSEKPKSPQPPSLDPKVEAEVNDKLKSLINTINMSPEELANKMFPDGAL